MPLRYMLCSAAVLSLGLTACAGDSVPRSVGTPPIDDEATVSSGQPERDTTPTATPTIVGPGASLPEPKVPGGDWSIFPDHRLVGFAGGRAPAFGRLEAADLAGAVTELAEIIPEYEADGRAVLPVFELISVIAHGSPTSSGLYRSVEPDEVIGDYLDAARRHDALLLLNVQPGRSDFLDGVKLLERWLLEPDVGLALDPEWAVADGEVPGQTYGSVTGTELDSVAAYVSELVEENDLPEKVVVFHQVHPSVVDDEDELGEHDGVALVKSVDGIGVQADKEKTWDRLMPTKPDHVHAGFKLFFDEDTRHGPLMTPEQVLSLEPLPEYVLYE